MIHVVRIVIDMNGLSQCQKRLGNVLLLVPRDCFIRGRANNKKKNNKRKIFEIGEARP